VLVTISGPPGAGTTTASLLVAERLGLDRLPGGEVFRALAAEAGMSLADFGAHAADHPEIDHELDRRLLARAEAGGVVIESRLAGWHVTRAGLRAVRTWIDCDPELRAGRVAAREGSTVEAALAESTARADLERARYLAAYAIDLDDRSIYDLELDSGHLGPDALADEIVRAAQAAFGGD
jgi:predicted cytidylate kinase